MIDGDDLVALRVRGSALGVRADAPVRIASFLTSAEDARRVLAPLAQGARVVLTLPAHWTSLRPIALTSAKWAGAREEVLRSVQGLFPLAADAAMVGLIDRGDAGDDPGGDSGRGGSPSGVIIAADRARVEPWTGALALASGRPVHAVLPTHAVVLGLGLQNEERCQVLERLASGALVAHRLRWGRFTEVGVSPSDTDASAGRRLVLDSEDRALGEVVGPEALALGAALAPLVAPSAYWPLSGPRPRAPRRWLSPLAAGLIVAALLWSAAAIAESRYERAAGALLAESESLTAPLEDAQRAKSDALRLAALLRKGVAQPAADWRRVLPDLAAAQSVIPEDGFLYRLEYDGRALGLTGEAKRASDVLTRLEATPEFDGARTLGASSIVEERSTEQFSIRADRAGAPPARAATGPGGAR